MTRYDAPTSFHASSNTEPSPLDAALEKQRKDAAEAAKAGPPRGAAYTKVPA